jgi:2'-phosphotransferase
MSQPASTCTPDAPAAIFDAYLAVRFATNADLQGTIRCPEIIEICAALICPDHRGIVAEFHAAVRPSRSPTVHATALSKVGLTQAQIDASPPFAVVFAELQKWLATAGFGDAAPNRSYCVAPVGGTDIARALKHQAQSDASEPQQPEAPVPAAFTRWASLFPLFVRIANKKAKRLEDMLPKLSAALPPETVCAIDANFAMTMAAAKARSPGALETVTGAKVLALMLHLGARPDFTTAPDVAQGFKHWRAFEEGQCCCAQESAEIRDKVLLPTVTSAATDAARDDDGEDDDGTASSSNGSSTKAPRGPPKQRGTLLQVPLARVARDPIQDILLVETVRATMLPAEFRALIRKMNVFLRLDALKCGLDMTIDGYVLLDAMLAHPRFRQVKKAPVAMICLENEKNRFSLVYGKDGRMYIRANHAHSFPEIDVNLTPIAIGDPVRYAVHGTNLKHWPSIHRDGLNRMARRFVVMKHHPAAAAATAAAADEGEDVPPLPLDAAALEASADFGLRRHSTCFICVNVQALLREGVPVYVNANRAIVSPGLDGVIPRRFFAGAVDIDGNDLLAADVA